MENLTQNFYHWGYCIPDMRCYNGTMNETMTTAKMIQALANRSPGAGTVRMTFQRGDEKVVHGDDGITQLFDRNGVLVAMCATSYWQALQRITKR